MRVMKLSTDIYKLRKVEKAMIFFLKGVFQNSNEGSISRRKLAMQT